MDKVINVIPLIAATAWCVYSMTDIFLLRLPNLIPSSILLLGFTAGIYLNFKISRSLRFIYKGKFLFLLIISTTTLSTILQTIFLNQIADETGRTTSNFLLTTTIINIAWLVIGSGISRYQLNTSLKISIIIILYIIACISINADDNYLINWAKMQAENESSSELNHLIVGFQAAFLLLLAFSISPKIYKIPIAFISSLIFFSLGGRTSLLCYIGTILLYNIIKNSIKSTLIIALTSLTLFITLYFNIEIDTSDQYLSRMFFQGGIDLDESKIARDKFLIEGINSLPFQSLFGNVNIFVEKYNTFGSYSHNILSAWQIYGLIPFLLLIYTIIYIGIKLKNIDLSNPNKTPEFGLLIYIFSTLSILTGKFIGFPMFWMAIGFWLTKPFYIRHH